MQGSFCLFRREKDEIVMKCNEKRDIEVLLYRKLTGRNFFADLKEKKMK